MLLKAGAEVNAKSDHGGTPLHVAALGGHAVVVTVLLKAGAEVEAKHRGGWSPLHAAASNSERAIRIGSIHGQRAPSIPARSCMGWLYRCDAAPWAATRGVALASVR